MTRKPTPPSDRPDGAEPRLGEQLLNLIMTNMVASTFCPCGCGQESLVFSDGSILQNHPVKGFRAIHDLSTLGWSLAEDEPLIAPTHPAPDKHQ